MASFDDLDAPQYSTFDDYDQEDAEQYFEIDHESERIKSTNENVASEVSYDENYYSPMTKTSISSDEQQNDFLELRNRKVTRTSMDNLVIPTQGMSNMCLNEISKLSVNKMKPNSEVEVQFEKKFEYGALRKGNSGSQSKLRFCSQESLNRLAAPKKIYSSTGNLANTTEYVSVAEAVKKFHERTPNRFHSQNSKGAVPKTAIPTKLKATIPMSPRLLTKKRVKANPQIISHDQKIQLEFEREQKFKVRAHPVNKRILEPMKAIHVEKKPTTVPEPFKLTKVECKKDSPKKVSYQFHAKPVPKSVIEPPKLPKKQEILPTNPITPSFIRRLPKPSPPKKEVDKCTTKTLKTTKPEPFSFEKRDERLIKKKEEKIKKILEEEKKAREFHARPIPKPIVSLINKQKPRSIDGSSSSLNTSEHVEHFKAKPPTVLYQKPFEPKKYDQPLTEIQAFTLNSEMRAREREKYERRKKELDYQAEMFRKQEEEAAMRREEEERRRFREETKFKAQPIKHFKGVIVQPSGKVTEPISPVFLSGKSNRKNKENENL